MGDKGSQGAGEIEIPEAHPRAGLSEKDQSDLIARLDGNELIGRGFGNLAFTHGNS